jgi:hypothetical protein
MKASKDYESFQPEFTRRSQLIAELVKKGIIDERGQLVTKPADQQSNSPFANNPQAQEAVKILKELGFITKEEADNIKKSIDELKTGYQSERENAQLTAAAKTLEEKYSGKSGEPKFDLQEIRTAIQKNPQLISYVDDGNGNFLVDLDQTYKNVHADFWGKIPEMRARLVKTERGSGPQTTTPTTQKKAGTPQERVDEALSFFKNADQSNQE